MIKRVKIDEFTLKHQNGKPLLFYKSKQVYPQIHSLKKSERAEIIQTAEAISRFVLREHGIQLDFEHKNIVPHMKLIVSELQEWSYIVEKINQEKSNLPNNVRFGVLHRVADLQLDKVGVLDRLPLMRPTLDKAQGRGSVLVFTDSVIPYLNLQTPHDLYSAYSNYLFIGKL